MITNGSPYGQYASLDGRSYFDRPRFHAFLAWLSTRVLRGGPRLLLQVTACVLGVYFLSSSLPERATDVAFRKGYGALWKWAGRKTGAAPVIDDGSVAGGLRIVVFGASDMATIPDDDSPAGETTWAEIMCTELDCSTYTSLVPKAPARSLSSNTLYASAIPPKSDAAPEKSTPAGLDYSFYPEAFPVPLDVPDFSAQVTSFLSRPRPQQLPRETLWVFNFGHWDIWNMAALSLHNSQSVVEAMVDDIVVNIERLYTAAMNESSIAHSDFRLYNSTTAMSAAGKAAKDRADQVAKGGKPTAADAQAIAEAQMAARDEPVEKETFRIVVPMIFDPTLAPGWRTERPNLPAVHSKAEQQRNAATLTELWNTKLEMAITEWAKKENPNPEGETPPATSAKEDARDERNEPKPLSRRADEPKAGDAQPAADTDAPSFRMISRRDEKGQQQSPPPPKTYPVRDAIIYDMQEYLTEIMVERQLRNVEYVDQNGLGNKSESQGFRDVSTPCVQRAAPKAPPSPESRFKGDSKTKDMKDAQQQQQQQAKASPPSARTAKRGEPGKRTEAARRLAKKAAGPGGASDEVCDNPRDRLFYTALTLSPRAVHEMAREIAELLIKNHTLRGYWDSLKQKNETKQQ